MKKTAIDPMDHMNEILRTLKKGVLVSTKAGDRVNSMTISWGQIGIEWNRLIFTTYIRTGRFTHDMLEQSGEFTVNIAPGGGVGKILSFCGTKSGRDHDKIAELGLTLVPGEAVAVPGLLELPMTLECKVIYKQAQDPLSMPADFLDTFYPASEGSENPGANRDYHTMFYGEIVGAYLASE